MKINMNEHSRKIINLCIYQTVFVKLNNIK